MKFYLSLLCFGVLSLSSIGQSPSPPTPSPPESDSIGGPSFDQYLKESQEYLRNRDLDGDGIADEILFDYSGGAHCCYTMSLQLSSQEDLLEYPFQMDGGYIFGVDGSNPHQFRIEDVDADGRMEIRMQIDMYNGRPAPWNKKWPRRYGIHQNDILFD